MPQKGRGIFLRPQVNVERVDAVEVLLLIPFVICVQVPLVLAGDRGSIQCKCEQRRLLV